MKRILLLIFYIPFLIFYAFKSDTSPENKSQSPDAYEKAYKTITDQTNNYPQPAPWKSLGPFNYSGRILSVEAAQSDRAVLYAGSAGGGLWKTTSAFTGGDWQRINLGYPVSSVSAIAIHPEDENIIFIGTGEMYKYRQKHNGIKGIPFRTSFGVGILKSEDGGSTWQKSLDWKITDKTAVMDIVFNPENYQTLLAATSEGIYRSVNSGQDWSKVSTVQMAQEITFLYFDTTYVVATCGSFGSQGSGVYFSSNGGKTWKKSTNLPEYNGKASLGVYLPEIPDWPAPPYQAPDILYASISDSNKMIGIYRSTKFGSAWDLVAPVDFAGEIGWYSNWILVNQHDENTLLNAGVFINKSTLRGNSFSSVAGPHSGHNDRYMDPKRADVIYLATDGGVYRSANFGDTFTNISYGLNTVQFNKGFSNSNSDSMLALGGTQRNGTLKYTGSSWSMITPYFSPIYHANPDIGGYTAINQHNNANYYCAYDKHLIFKTEDNGGFFNEISTSHFGDSANVTPFVMSEQNPAILYTATDRIFKSTDSAKTWQTMNNGQVLDGNIITTLAISPHSNDIIVAATIPAKNPAHLFISINGGENWSTVSETLPNQLAMDVAFDPKDRNTLYVVYDGSGSGHVFKSQDLGNSWQDITSNLPDIPTLSILVDPLNPNYIYVGNELAVYVSDNAGQSWQPMMDGLPENIIAMDLSFTESNRKLRLATHGNGLYETKTAYQPEIYLTSRNRKIDTSRLLNYDDTLSFKLDVKNWGIQTLSEDYSATLHIIDSTGKIVYTEKKDTCCLQPDKKNIITLSKNYTPPGKGQYLVQYIYPQPFNEGFDTSKTHFEIVDPTIIKPRVTKKHQPFRRIKSKRIVDNDPQVIDLPFPFIYDGHEYDKVQVSQNGFAEFGSGEAGQRLGISTSGQLSQSNYSIAQEQRPSKVIAPWWEPLSGGSIFGITAEISYITEGIAPDRVFVIQWLRMQTSGSTYLNFQVRLYESDYRIEFSYGDALTGLYNGHGAVIGIKDHIGGAYHYYDLTSNTFKNHHEMPSFRSPLTHWPGPDSSYVIYTRTSLDDNFHTPSGMALWQPYPNPFNSEITIAYKLPENSISNVRLEIYDILGRRVRTLVNNKQTDGHKKSVWNGLNDSGDFVSSGIYFAVLKVDGNIKSKKIALIR